MSMVARVKWGVVVAAALLCLPAGASRAVSDDTVDFVKMFLKTETEALPPALVPRFIKVDEKELPRMLRPEFRAKELELETLRKLAEGKRKPPVRRAGKEPVEAFVGACR